VEQAFRTQIHRYDAEGEIHFANATAPSVPAAFANVVTGIGGLHDFRLKPKIAHYTSPTSGRNYLAPDDVAVIYNLNPLYAAGINGTGQKLAVVGQTQITLSDLQQFRISNGLAPNDPQITLVPKLPDPGIVSGDFDEANLDLEWSAAVARNATVLYIYSENVFDALQYAVDNNVAPVISMSYGLCELQTGNADLNAQRTIAQQAVAQGITWLASSGDSGAADCWSSRGRTITSLAVDAPAVFLKSPVLAAQHSARAAAHIGTRPIPPARAPRFPIFRKPRGTRALSPHSPPVAAAPVRSLPSPPGRPVPECRQMVFAMFPTFLSPPRPPTTPISFTPVASSRQ